MALFNKDIITSESLSGKKTNRTGISKLKLLEANLKKPSIYKVPNPISSASSAPFVNQYRMETKDEHHKYKELKNAYHVDSYIRQSIDKFAEKICANSYNLSNVIKSKKPEIKKYLVKRLSLMGRAQGYDIPLLFLDVSRRIVRDGNSFLVKAYVDNIDIPGYKIKPMRGQKLIGGYFILESENMVPIIDQGTGLKKGWVYRWKDGSVIKDKLFPTSQIHHFVYCPEGPEGWGQSQNLPAIEDVRSLRSAEEAVLKLIYRFLNPMIHVTAPDLLLDGQGRQEDVDLAAEILVNMANDGFVVTGPGYSMTAIGAESQALRAEPYLKFFKERGFSGLGVSALIMGEGAYVGNAGASALSIQMHDRARTYQKILDSFITNNIISELLVEGGFDIFDKETGEPTAYWEFEEFDEEEKRKIQTHYADLFTKGVLPRSRVLAKMGEKPLTAEEEKDTFQAISVILSSEYGSKVSGIASQPKE